MPARDRNTCAMHRDINRARCYTMTFLMQASLKDDVWTTGRPIDVTAQPLQVMGGGVITSTQRYYRRFLLCIII
jgi:hypothetical protein